MLKPGLGAFDAGEADVILEGTADIQLFAPGAVVVDHGAGNVIRP